MTDEDGRYGNGSPILEACASDEIHSAVSHNPNTLDGSFRLIVRKKHSPLAHVPVLLTLRYPARDFLIQSNREGLVAVVKQELVFPISR